MTFYWDAKQGKPVSVPGDFSQFPRTRILPRPRRRIRFSGRGKIDCRFLSWHRMSTDALLFFASSPSSLVSSP